MRQLIINADDLGANTQRSHGIFEAIEFGIVTSTTLMANMQDSDRAGKHARERGVTTGLHLNLTEEYPLSKRDDIDSLLEGNGMFLSREKFFAAIDDQEIKKEHLEREIRSQIEWMLDVCGSLTHIDGHHHVHAHPFVADALIPILERYAIRFIRMPIEEPLPPFGYIIGEEQLEWVRGINEMAKGSQKMYAAYGIGSSDHFRGLTLAGNASLKNIRHIIGRLPEGTTELMVHPGSAISYGTPFDLDPQRQTELRMLTDPSIRKELQDRKISLASYADF